MKMKIKAKYFAKIKPVDVDTEKTFEKSYVKNIEIRTNYNFIYLEPEEAFELGI
jgi:hypothetical protein